MWARWSTSKILWSILAGLFLLSLILRQFIGPPVVSRAEQFTAEKKNAVAAHQIIAGMTTSDVNASWGPPDDKYISGGAGVPTETWFYRHGGYKSDVLIFANGVLVRWTVNR